ncbi:MAG: pilin [Patescibacteria group bacterium]
MKSFPKILTIFFLTVFILQIICLFFLLMAPAASQAADAATFKPQVEIPGTKKEFGATDKTGGYVIPGSTETIGKYVKAIYKYAIGIVGILAAVVLMFGGVIWLTAGGNATRIGEAKAWIIASLTGLTIAVCSFLILATVNPNLVEFKITPITNIEYTPENDIEHICDYGASDYIPKNAINGCCSFKNDSKIKTIDATDYECGCIKRRNVYEDVIFHKGKISNPSKTACIEFNLENLGGCPKDNYFSASSTNSTRGNDLCKEKCDPFDVDSKSKFVGNVGYCCFCGICDKNGANNNKECGNGKDKGICKNGVCTILEFFCFTKSNGTACGPSGVCINEKCKSPCVKIDNDCANNNPCCSNLCCEDNLYPLPNKCQTGALKDSVFCQ